MARKKRTPSHLGTKGGGNWGPAIPAGRRPQGVPGAPGEIRRPARWKPGEVAMAEIIKYQKDGGYLIPKAAFARLVMKICREQALGGNVIRWQRSALEALQVAAEDYLVIVMNSKILRDPELKISC